MTTPPSSFDIGRAVGNNISGAFKKVREDTSIDNILREAGKSKDPEAIDFAINSIISNVSTERQKPALDFLNEKKKGIFKEREVMAKQKANLLPSLNNAIKALDLGKSFSTDDRDKILQLSEKFIDQGLSANDASLAATRTFLAKQEQDAQQQEIIDEKKKEEESFGKAAKKVGGSLLEAFNRDSLFAQLMGRQRTPEEIAKELEKNPGFGQQVAASIGSTVPDLIPIIGLTPALGGPGAFAVVTAMKTAAQQIGEAAKAGEIDLPGVTPGTNLFFQGNPFKKGGSIDKNSNIYNEKMAKRGEKLLKDSASALIMGKVLETIPGLKQAIAKTPIIGKYLNNYASEQAVLLGAEVTALSAIPAIVEGRLPTSHDFAHGLATVVAFKAGGKLSEVARSSIESARSKNPAEVKIFDEAFSKLTPEEAKSVAEAESPEQVSKVVESAMDRLKLRNVEVVVDSGKSGKVAQKTEVPEVTGKGKLQPKEKETSKALEKIAKSPSEYVEKYTEKQRKPEEGQERKTPAGQASEMARVERLQVKEKQVLEDFKTAKEEVDRIHKAIKEAKPENKVKLETNALYAQREAAKLRESLRDIKHEMKWGRPRPTPEALELQISESFKGMQEDIKNPVEKDAKQIAKIEKQIETLKKDLEIAQDLTERGELPKVDYEDTYVRVEKQYADAYKDMIEKVSNEIEDLKGSKEPNEVKQLKDLNEFRDRLKSRLKHNEAKTTIQKDKIRGKNLLKGAKGAFNKQLLKQMRQDVAELQREYFEHRKLLGNEEIKTSKAAKNAIDKLVNEYVKDPSDANAQKVSKESGVPKAEVVKAKESLSDVIKKNAEAAKDPTPDKIKEAKKSELKAKQIIDKIFSKYSNNKGKIFVGGIISSLIGGIIDESFDKDQAKTLKVPLKILSGLGKFTSYSTFGLGKALQDFMKSSFDDSRLEEFKKSSPLKRNQLMKEWRKKYGETRANRIYKRWKEDH